MAYSINLQIPDGFELVRLAQTPNGWDCAVIMLGISDKFGRAIPSQYGYGWAQHVPNKALEIALAEARRVMSQIKAKRNGSPPVVPGTSEEDQLLQLLGL